MISNFDDVFWWCFCPSYSALISTENYSHTSMKSTRFESPWFPVSSMVELIFKWHSDPHGSAIIKFPIPREPKVLYATERWIRWEANSRDTNKQQLGMLFRLIVVIALSGVQFGWLTKSDLIKTEYDYKLKWMNWCSVSN